MLKAWIPLILCFAIVVAVIIVLKNKSETSARGPAEKDGMKKCVLIAMLTDSWLLGWLYAKKNYDYDYDERRLK